MFYNHQNKEFKQKYIDSLSIIGSLSNLFSDSKVPYLYYRIAEKLFCDAFYANNLSRGDIALDASKDGVGIGLKTFLQGNNKTLQKVAEFNKDRYLYKNQNDIDVINTISALRNRRIEFAEKLSGVDKSYYHCVLRKENKFSLYEETMDYIDILNLKDINRKKNIIWFNDGLHEYSFNLSKSTLVKRFNTNQFLEELNIQILENPLENIQACLFEKSKLWEGKNTVIDTVYLPLYGKNKIVSEKSGLNQWNASGRERHPNEIYIPIPAKVHRYSSSFFPQRDKPFNLHLPNGEVLNVKVCQDNSKALMSNPNKALGKWLLRDVLGLEEGELLTYEKLQTIGIDSIRLDKIDNKNFKINFVSSGSFEEYLALYED